MCQVAISEVFSFLKSLTHALEMCVCVCVCVGSIAPKVSLNKIYV